MAARKVAVARSLVEELGIKGATSQTLVLRGLYAADGTLKFKLVGKSAGLVIERFRVRIPAGAAGKFSSPELTLCANSCPVSVQPPCYHSGT